MTPSDIYLIFGFYDPKWCIRVKGGTHVICMHAEPFVDVTKQRIETKQNEVQLYLYTDGIRYGIPSKKVLGYAGRCEVCGKVYYREE